MSNPTALELQALEQAGTLLKFAAENKQVPENVIHTIVQTREAVDTNTWTPETSAKFWVAYNSLCVGIKPVTLDTISNNDPPSSPARRFFWRSSVPVSKRAAWISLYILVVLLLLSIVFQFSVSTASNLISEADKIRSEVTPIAENASQQIAAIREELAGKKFSESSLTPDQNKAIASIRNGFRQIWLKEEAIHEKLKLAYFLTSLRKIGEKWETGTPETRILNSVADFDSNLTRHYSNETYFSSSEERASLNIKMLNSALVLLLGLVGASAYVTRLISEQIKESTFSRTSPIRHLVRVALGGLAGAIVGFGWISSGISASPLALAFIAGYAIEPVFATVDNIAEKFRQHSG